MFQLMTVNLRGEMKVTTIKDYSMDFVFFDKLAEAMRLSSKEVYKLHLSVCALS